MHNKLLTIPQPNNLTESVECVQIESETTQFSFDESTRQKIFDAVQVRFTSTEIQYTAQVIN